MPISHRASVLTFGFCLAASLIAGQEQVPQRSGGTLPNGGPPTVSVKSFGPRQVIGFLGHPLGTVVRVTGVAFENNAKGDDDGTLLRIEQVNGVPLAEAWAVRARRAEREIPAPRPGERFDYYVHEYGSFDGVVEPPRHLGINRFPVQTDGFHYRPAVTIHKSNGAAPAPPAQRAGNSAGPPFSR